MRLQSTEVLASKDVELKQPGRSSRSLRAPFFFFAKAWGPGDPFLVGFPRFLVGFHSFLVGFHRFLVGFQFFPPIFLF